MVIMQIAYRAVDEHCVENAIDSLMKSVLKHVNQTIALFDERNGPEGSIITAGQHSFLHVDLDVGIASGR
jgi:hypothetical protein